MISFERAEEIANLYYDDIFHFCLSKLKREEEAKDVTQEVFLLFQKKCDDLGDKNIKAWLTSVADRKIREEYRKIAKREKELIWGITEETNEIARSVFEAQQDDIISDEEIDEIKDSIMSSLSEKELALFYMLYEKHMNYEQICKELAISNATLRVRACRLRAKINERVSFAFMVLLLLFIKF